MIRPIAAIALALVLMIPPLGAPLAQQDSAALAQGIVDTAEVLRSGTLEGRSNNVAAGQVDVARLGELFYVILRDDFVFDGAPDPQLGFGAAGESWVASSVFSALNLDAGFQVYRLPVGLDPTAFDGFMIWCEQFSVPLAYARFDTGS